jgi:hypothetical protein
MAQRARFRFAVIDIELTKADVPLHAGQVAIAIKTGLGDHWGELGSFVVAPFMRVVSIEKVTSRRFLCVLRYPRDFQEHVLSTCALVWTIGDVVAAVRLRKIAGSPKNAQETLVLLRQTLLAGK